MSMAQTKLNILTGLNMANSIFVQLMFKNNNANSDWPRPAPQQGPSAQYAIPRQSTSTYCIQGDRNTSIMQQRSKPFMRQFIALQKGQLRREHLSWIHFSVADSKLASLQIMQPLK
jgi:hypothetical protein